MQESIGMLSAAYFASRSQILEWLNSLLGVQYTKIEQTASRTGQTANRTGQTENRIGQNRFVSRLDGRGGNRESVV